MNERVDGVLYIMVVGETILGCQIGLFLRLPSPTFSATGNVHGTSGTLSNPAGNPGWYLSTVDPLHAHPQVHVRPLGVQGPPPRGVLLQGGHHPEVGLAAGQEEAEGVGQQRHPQAEDDEQVQEGRWPAEGGQHDDGHDGGQRLGHGGRRGNFVGERFKWFSR